MLKKVARTAAKWGGFDLRRHRAPEVEIFVSLCEARNLDTLPIDTAERRFLRHCLELAHLSTAQAFQDAFVDLVLNKRGGTFCEFGATDGISLSNSRFLEAHRGWRGVLAEPARSWHPALKRNRPDATVDFRCVYSASGQSLAFNEPADGVLSTIASYSEADIHRRARRAGNVYEVETITLNDLLSGHGIGKLDYLSVDTEGSELDILTEFDFGRFAPAIVTVEHNFTSAREGLLKLLTAQGYVRVFEKYSAFDDWYVQEKVWTEWMQGQA
ncbi:MAG TPA: FkbM family methyltransferase [Allosphingosinicella sp.]